MTRCFVNPAQWNQTDISLSTGESHHLLRVLRVRRNKLITVFNGQGQTAEAEVIKTADKHVRIRILEKTRCTAPRHSVLISLIQSIPKHSLMNVIIQKATELGIFAIHPLLTERVIVHLNKQEIQKRRDRWQRIALEAAKQCGCNWLPEIHPIVPCDRILRQLSSFDLCFVASLHRKAKPIREAIKSLNKTMPKTIGMIIGPEGDFTDEETDSFISAGGIPVSFGPVVLRVETAAMFGISILTYEFSDSAS